MLEYEVRDGKYFIVFIGFINMPRAKFIEVSNQPFDPKDNLQPFLSASGAYDACGIHNFSYGLVRALQDPQARGKMAEHPGYQRLLKMYSDYYDLPNLTFDDLAELYNKDGGPLSHPKDIEITLYPILKQFYADIVKDEIDKGNPDITLYYKLQLQKAEAKYQQAVKMTLDDYFTYLKVDRQKIDTADPAIRSQYQSRLEGYQSSTKARYEGAHHIASKYAEAPTPALLKEFVEFEKGENGKRGSFSLPELTYLATALDVNLGIYIHNRVPRTDQFQPHATVSNLYGTDIENRVFDLDIIFRAYPTGNHGHYESYIANPVERARHNQHFTQRSDGSDGTPASHWCTQNNSNIPSKLGTFAALGDLPKAQVEVKKLAFDTLKAHKTEKEMKQTVSKSGEEITSKNPASEKLSKPVQSSIPPSILVKIETMQQPMQEKDNSEIFLKQGYKRETHNSLILTKSLEVGDCIAKVNCSTNQMLWQSANFTEAMIIKIVDDLGKISKPGTLYPSRLNLPDKSLEIKFKRLLCERGLAAPKLVEEMGYKNSVASNSPPNSSVISTSTNSHDQKPQLTPTLQGQAENLDEATQEMVKTTLSR